MGIDPYPNLCTAQSFNALRSAFFRVSQGCRSRLCDSDRASGGPKKIGDPMGIRF